jgi:AraC-like DNA-binding protein
MPQILPPLPIRPAGKLAARPGSGRLAHSGHGHSKSESPIGLHCVEVQQRRTETSLQAVDITNSLNISKRTLHRVLAACSETFGAMLIQARVDLASRMLQSPLFDRVTAAEVGRRAGSSDASHFTKVLRRYTGQTPLQMRRARHSNVIARVGDCPLLGQQRPSEWPPLHPSSIADELLYARWGAAPSGCLLVKRAR